MCPSTRDYRAELQTALERARLSFNLEGAVLFGSSATGRADLESDLDVLAVGQGLNPKPHRRSHEIVEIKRLLPGVPVDVLLLTPEETLSNFDNHNPLFLDISEDGIVLVDPKGLLRAAIDRTRRYLRERGIERTTGGWRFPVSQGSPTFLSKVSNRDFAYAMLNDGNRDLQVGRYLAQEGFYDKSVYHCQQAVEKSVKAVLIALGVFRRTHLVGAALREVSRESRVPEEWREKLAEIAGISEELEADLSLSRYPGIINDLLWLPYEEYGGEDAQSAGVKAVRAVEVVQEFLKSWFSGDQSSAS